MMQSANNGHSHGSHPSAASHYPPHLDPRYMEYANMAHHHPGVVDPHLHYGLPPASLPQSHVGGSALKRNADSAGLDMMGGTPSSAGGVSSDEDSDIKPPLGDRTAGTGRGKSTGPDPATGKKTKGRVKIKMEFIDNKLRRYTTFSKRKTGIMKKAYELSTLTGTQVMLLVASETGHVYTFATRKLQPMITSDAGKALIQTCLNSPDPMPPGTSVNGDQRMSATGYEETELTYNIAAAADEEQQQKVRQMMYNSHHAAAAAAHHHAYSPASSAAAAALFTPHSSATGLNSMSGHSPYGSHPGPSPSPASSAYGGGMSLSPGPTSHHSPPFAPPSHSQR